MIKKFNLFEKITEKSPFKRGDRVVINDNILEYDISLHKYLGRRDRILR